MTDPRNTSQPETDDTIEFEAPPIEETARFRSMLNMHREAPEIYIDIIRRG